MSRPWGHGGEEFFTSFEVSVESVFVVPMRGVAVTGIVTAGRVSVGQNASLYLPEGPRQVTVSKIDVRRRRAKSAESGTTVAIYLNGLRSADLPSKLEGSGAVIDADAMRGTRLSSR